MGRRSTPRSCSRATACASTPTVFSEALGENALIADEDMWPPWANGLFAGWIAQLGSDSRGSGDPADVLPVYTRLSDAEENERIKAGLTPRPTPESGVSGGELL